LPYLPSGEVRRKEVDPADTHGALQEKKVEALFRTEKSAAVADPKDAFLEAQGPGKGRPRPEARRLLSVPHKVGVCPDEKGTRIFRGNRNHKKMGPEVEDRGRRLPEP